MTFSSVPVLSAVTLPPLTLTIPLPSPVTVAPEEAQVIYMVRSNSVLDTLSSESSVSSLLMMPPPDSPSWPTMNFALTSPAVNVTYAERAVPSLAGTVTVTDSPLAPSDLDRVTHDADAVAVHSVEDVTVTLAEPPSFAMDADVEDRLMLSLPAYFAKLISRPSVSLTYTLSSSLVSEAKTGMLLPSRISFILFHALPYQAYQ